MQQRIAEALAPPETIIVDVGDMGYEMHPASQAEMDAFVACFALTTQSAYRNETIAEIVSEEAAMYFAGDQTAEQTAKQIQSRVQLYLSESQ